MTWQPIETAPKGTVICGWNGKRVTTYIWFDTPDDDEYVGWCFATFSGGGSLYCLHNACVIAPTHWMPLPLPPTD